MISAIYNTKTGETTFEEKEFENSYDLSKIIQVSKLKTWFDQNYREYFEKLTRREAIGVSKPIVDPIRNKTYNTLNDLYLEAEKVAEEIKSLEGE